MAGLRLKGNNKYYARILIWNGVKQKERLIPLKTETRSTALIRHKMVERVELDIKLGIEFTFPWLDECSKTSIRIRYLHDFIEEFLNNKKVSPNTLESYRYTLNYLCKCMGKVLLEEINVKSIDKYKQWLIINTNNTRSASINIHLRGVRVFLNWCKEREYLIKVPKIEFEDVESNEEKYITDYEYNIIICHPYNDNRFPRMYKLYWETGMRLKEAFYGHIVGINGNKWLDIPKEHSKSKKSKSIQINEEQAETIEMIQRIWKDKGSTESHIKYYSKMLKKVMKANGINKRKVFHSFRHSFGMRRIIQLNGNITRLRDELGHHSVVMTEIYSKGLDPKRLLVDFPSLKEYIDNDN